MRSIFDFFSPPIFSDNEDKTRSAFYLHWVVLIGIPIAATFVILRTIAGESALSFTNFIFIIIIGVFVSVFFTEKQGQIRSASQLLIIVIWVAITLLAFNGNGLKGAGPIGYLALIALAALVVGDRTALITAAFSVLSIFGLAAAEIYGGITPLYEDPYAASVQITTTLILAVAFIYFNQNNLENIIKLARKTSQDFEKSNRALRELQKSLENKSQERLDSLLKANMEIKRRSAQFQTVSQITQKISLERDLDTLLSAITEVISNQFNHYHVAVYLNDDVQEHTVLSATSSEGGRRMLERGHRLPIEQTNQTGSSISYVAKAGASRTNPNISAEEARLNNLDLPETRSEIALPLKSGAQIIGVLDVQSKKADAFDQADIEALNAIANQIMIAVQNTRLFAETQTALAESQLLYGTVIKQTWTTNTQADAQIGYRYAGIKPVPLSKEIFTPEIRDALENGDVAITHPSRRKEENALAVPLKLRESTIGVISVKFPPEMELSEDEIDVVRAASQRIAIALENASLLEESQRRARREQTISAISAKISAGTEIDTILKTAIRELGSQISGAQITVELGNEDE